MKKIALINPPFRGVIHRIKDAYPLGLGYIKAYCESKGVVCDLYDFSCSLLSDQALEEKYCLSDYDVIGVSSYSLKKDKLLIYYSASGNWTPYYCVGLLTADTDSDLLNPASWKKAPEPVFKQAPENHVYGPGSICFIPSPDGKEWYMLYHARKSLYDMLVLDSRTPRMQKIEWDKEGIPVLGIPQKEGFPLRKPSGTPERK